MKPLRYAALTFALLTAFTLAGCDNNDKPKSASAPEPASASSAAQTPAASAMPDKAKRDELAARSEGKPLNLLDASEVQLDGSATLVLTFSVPLDPDQNFAQVVHLVDKKSG